MADNIITKFPEGLDYLNEQLDVMGIPNTEQTAPMRKQMIQSIILTLARQ